MQSNDTSAISAAGLLGVRIETADLPRALRTYEAICGTTPRSVGRAPSGDRDRAAFALGDAVIQIVSVGPDDHPKGLASVLFTVPDLEAAARALVAAGAMLRTRDGRLEIDRGWAGVAVEVRERAEAPGTAVDAHRSASAGAVLDHVALLVGDLGEMAARWTAILGTPPAALGVHPLGVCLAARFVLGDRMIELVAPLPERDSALRTRHERAGDGPFGLAIIATDLERTIGAVSAVGARILDQPPHRIVHPSDAGGIPVQLTPRVHHEHP